MENVFDTLCSALNESSIKSLFLTSEGIDLMVLMMKYVSRIHFCSVSHAVHREKLQSRSRSIKTLDYAMSGTTGSASCDAFVEALGLKTLFSALMGKVSFPVLSLLILIKATRCRRNIRPMGHLHLKTHRTYLGYFPVCFPISHQRRLLESVCLLNSWRIIMKRLTSCWRYGIMPSVALQLGMPNLRRRRRSVKQNVL